MVFILMILGKGNSEETKPPIKLADLSRGRPVGSLFFSFYQRVGLGTALSHCFHNLTPVTNLVPIDAGGLSRFEPRSLR